MFLPDYDMAMAKHLYPGCDVWMNNPLRPYRGMWHLGNEGGPERRSEPVDPRRVVG